jgi:hypothetical protein
LSGVTGDTTPSSYIIGNKGAGKSRSTASIALRGAKGDNGAAVDYKGILAGVFPNHDHSASNTSKQGEQHWANWLVNISKPLNLRIVDETNLGIARSNNGD